MPRFFTNTYSNYTPTKVGDTVQEQALLSKVQASNYLQANKEYSDTEDVLNNLDTAPGGEWGLNQFKDYYGSEYQKAEKEGNLEDMVGNAGKLIKKGYEDYNLARIIKDKDVYQNNMKALEEAKIPENYKEVTKMKIKDSNPGYYIDPDTGEKKFKPYTPVAIPTYAKVDEELSKILSGWEADNVYTRDENGKITVNQDLLDETGRVYLKKGEVVTRAEIADYTRSFLNNEEFIKQSLQDQADINVSEIALKSGKFDEEEFNYLISKNNPYAQGTQQYNDFQKLYTTAFNDRLKTAKEEAAITGLKFDEASAKFNIAKNLQENLLTNSYIDNAMDKFGYEREELSTYKIKDLEEESKSGSKVLESLNIATYVPILVGSSDTKDGATINMGNLYENKKNLQTSLQQAKSSLAALEADPNASQVTKDKQRALVEQIQSDIENTNIISEMNASSTVNTLLDNGFKFNRKFLYSDNKEVSNIENYEDLKTAAYEDYLDSTKIALSKNLSPRTEINEAYSQINYDYTIPEDNESLILSKQQFDEVFEDTLNKNLQNIETSSIPVIREYVKDIKYEYDKFKKQKPNAINMFQNYQLFDLAFANTTTKDRGPYTGYLQAMEGISKIVKEDLGAFKTFDGMPLSQLVDNETTQINGDVSVRLMNSPINGKLAAQVVIPVKQEGKPTELKTMISLDTDNSNSVAINDIVHNAFGDLSTILTTDYSKLNADKVNMLNAVNSIVNITDGTTAKFDALPLETSKEGDKFEFDIADANFEFITWREGKGNSRNKFLILEDNVEALTVTENGKDPRNSVVNRGKAYGKGVLGYHINDLNPETLLPKKGIQPKYFLIEGNENTDAVTIKGKDIVPEPWFVPYDAGSAAKVREKITLDVATRRGTFNKNALPLETMMPNPDTYIKNYTNSTTIKNKLDKQATLYTPEKGYTRLDEIVLPNEISTRSNLNFVALNSEGINRASKMFSDLRTKGLKPVVTGAGRDSNNVVEESAEHSKHKKFGGLDILKNEAGIYILQLFKTNPKALEEYGISNVLGGYDSHIHIEFKDNLLNPFTEVTQEQYKSLGI
jgi:hypothetical protein